MTHYVHWVLRHRLWVIATTLLVTAVLGVFSAGLKIVIDPVTMAPQDHPYVQATRHIDQKFGSKYLMVIAVTPTEGDIFSPGVLDAVQRMTRALETTPGVVRSTMVSLAARQAKGISGSADSFEARPLLDPMPATAADQAALKAVLQANPVYLNAAVSADFRTAAILVELKERSDGFRNMVDPVYRIVDAEKRPGLKIALGGSPVYMDTTERFADRILWLFPIALLVIGLLHFEAFRTWQGFVLPLVTALMAVLWGLGFMGVLHQPLDIFNSPTPILILAVAAGHAVQLLKRYYEEYEALRQVGALSPAGANREAVLRSVAGVGPVMVIAGGVAALGFFSLMVFEIETIRTFGLFTGIGILSAVVLEMTFIPAVRSLLKPPREAIVSEAVSAAAPNGKHRQRIWDRIPRLIADHVVPAPRRHRLMAALSVFAALCVAGMANVHVNSDAKTFFSNFLPLQQDDDFLNRTLGGTNSLYVMVEGREIDALKSPELLRAVESTQRFAESLPGVGKTISIVDYLKRMNRAMHADDVAFDTLPASRELVSQYLLLYSMSGEPGDFDAYIDNDFKTVKITLLLKTGGSARVRVLLDRLKAHTTQAFGPGVTVSFGGEAAQTIALSDTLIKGKLLNIAQIALAIFTISALAFRSLLAGVIVLAPLGLAVLAVFGVMGALGIPLNVPNSLISAMAVGIGADYAIYLLYRMRELARLGADAETAVRQSLATAGKAALFVATAVAGGYGVLSLSIGYNVHLWLSLFIVVAMVVSAFASLIVVPSLVLYWKPAFVLRSAMGGPAPWRLAAVLAIGSIVALAGPRHAHAEGDNRAESALSIMQKNQSATKVKDSVSNATFTLTSKDGSTRVRKTLGQTRLQDGSDDNMRLVRFLSPADIKGTSILLVEHAKADDDMWLYLPALGKVRRLSAANKKDSFVGTDFSYADVIGYKAEQWTHRLVGEETVNGTACFVVESVPVDDSVRQTTGYGKRVTWVGKTHFVALRIDISDVAMQPLKRIVASDIQPVGTNKRWQPMRTEAENLQTGHRTLIEFEGFQADRNIASSLFAAKELEK